MGDACFDRPDEPLYYFNTTLEFVEKHNMFEILTKGGVEPDDMGGYSGSEIARAITDTLELQVEIVFYKIGERLQLSEVRVCFARNGSRMACPTPFRVCQESDTIWFLPG
ncbi:uncharacterized protein LOC120001266 [Tripterygium wilfordii]|uniref:uncharacterized protein LOC120001266 n=1 Tax=Tripterygium wilfordii TaxID=458696 RepID=UPI0018F833BD|nr:uncharacterized protein LOC120001266 [Tripterygium wilfordii]